MNGLTATAHSAETALQPWMQESVRTFFEQVAWDGRPLPAAAQVAHSTPVSSDPMTLSVDAFFSTLPWDGQPVVAAPVAPLELLIEEPKVGNDSLTLDAFSDLF